MKPTFPILAAVAVAAAGGWYAFSGTNAVNSTPINPLVSAANAQSADTAEADAPAATTEIQDMTLGNPDSAVQIIEYASYTCPHCAAFDQGPFQQLKAEQIVCALRGGGVRLSPHFYTRPEVIEQTLAVIRNLRAT